MTELMSLRLDKEVKKQFIELTEKLSSTQSSLFSAMIKKYCKMRIIELKTEAVALLNKDSELNKTMGKEIINSELKKINVLLKVFCEVIEYTPIAFEII